MSQTLETDYQTPGKYLEIQTVDDPIALEPIKIVNRNFYLNLLQMERELRLKSFTSIFRSRL